MGLVGLAQLKCFLLNIFLDAGCELVDAVAVVREVALVAELAVVHEDELAALLAGLDVRHQAVAEPAVVSESALVVEELVETEDP